MRERMLKSESKDCDWEWAPQSHDPMTVELSNQSQQDEPSEIKAISLYILLSRLIKYILLHTLKNEKRWLDSPKSHQPEKNIS